MNGTHWSELMRNVKLEKALNSDFLAPLFAIEVSLIRHVLELLSRPFHASKFKVYKVKYTYMAFTGENVKYLFFIQLLLLGLFLEPC